MQPKILRYSLSCLGAVTLTACGTHQVFADPFLPVPPASFINYHVDTVAQLAHQVTFDAVVRGRLARHFHRSPADVTAYIHDNLVLMHLKQAGQYRVACVTPSGRELHDPSILKGRDRGFRVENYRTAYSEAGVRQPVGCDTAVCCA